jgi:serine/threonine-protein kinase HipA
MNLQRYEVKLHDTVVGVIDAHDNHSEFRFVEQYIADNDRHVLGLAFEDDLLARHRANLRLPVWFSNLLPDKDAPLRRLIARDKKVTEVRELQLLEHVGLDLPGAVRVTLSDHADHKLAASVREVVVGSNTWRFSLAGMAMKVSVRASDQYTLTLAGPEGDWVAKFPSAQYPCLVQNENAMMCLARMVGIDVPETRLVHRTAILDLPDGIWPEKQEFAFAIRRFDRKADGSRVHFEDLAQAIGRYAEDKFVGSFDAIAAVMYRGHDPTALTEFVRRLAFNFIIGNDDAHLKNWALIYREPRKPSIAPAYDLLSTIHYGPESLAQRNLGLKFCGRTRFSEVNLALFRRMHQRLENQFGAIGVQFDAVAKSIADAIQMHWPEVEALLSDCPDLQKKIATGIQHRLAVLML